MVKKTINATLMMLGGITLATWLHEIYHSLIFKTAHFICYEFGTGAVMSVWGDDESVWNNEIFAYLVSLVVVIIVMYYIYRYMVGDDK